LALLHGEVLQDVSPCLATHLAGPFARVPGIALVAYANRNQRKVKRTDISLLQRRTRVLTAISPPAT
jgi:hypothetical protein